MFTFLSLPLLSLLAVASFVAADDTDTCDTANTGLRVGTLQYTSDCNATTWCNSGTCQNKKCRRDEYPLGWPSNIDMPDRCGTGTFCPDEESECLPQLAVGSACQFNRDDECEGPPDFADLRDTSSRGLNVNGSICLNFVCTYANVTVGQTCQVENTGYIAYGADNAEFVDIVSRDNCKIGLYCDTNSKVCIQQKEQGDSCDADKECLTYNCDSKGVCGLDPSLPLTYPAWLYVIVGIVLFGGMFLTLFILFFLHRRQRDAEREKRLQYWREQNAFRQNIMSMRDTARASIFSMSGAMTPHSNRTTIYSQAGGDSESTAPMLHKSSGLRQGYVNEGASREDSMYDDQYEGEGGGHSGQSREGSEAMYAEKRF